MMRFVRVTIGKLLAATLLTLCVGVQALEATGRWDRTLQDTGDEAVIVTIVLCVGAALIAAAVARDRLTPSAVPIAIITSSATSLPVFGVSARQTVDTSPPLSLRI